MSEDSGTPIYEKIEDDPVLSKQFDLSVDKPSEIQRGMFASWLRDDVSERLVKAEKKAVWIGPFASIFGLVAGLGMIFIVVANYDYMQQEPIVSLIPKDNSENIKKRSQDPELWLTYISELLRGNQVNAAEQELKAFRIQFPDHK